MKIVIVLTLQTCDKYWEHSVQGHLRMLCADFLIKDGITWENAISKLFINAAV